MAPLDTAKSLLDRLKSEQSLTEEEISELREILDECFREINEIEDAIDLSLLTLLGDDTTEAHQFLSEALRND